MYYILLILVCISALTFHTGALYSASELFLKPCKATDPFLKQCWLGKIEDLRSYLIRGVPELRIRSIDPLVIPKISVGKRSLPGASYEVQYRNIVYVGAREFQILDFAVDADALLFKLKIFIPVLNFTTSYRFKDGIILGFRLDGDGNAKAGVTNLIIDLVLDGERYTKSDQEHIRWREGSTEISFNDSYVQHYDIIKDPTELSAFNYILNESTKTFLRVIYVSFLGRTVGNYIIESINRVHEAFPKNSLYPIY